VTAGSLAAVDLGASSGRVMSGHVGPRTLELREVHRFPNDPVALPDGLHWDLLRIQFEVMAGLRAAGRETGRLLGVAVDSWGVDYGLLDRAGSLIGAPFHYRDARTEPAIPAVHAVVPFERLYARTGTQFQPFNTVYQLTAEGGTSRFEAARTMLMVPDLIGYWLTGVMAAEETNGSTTGLFDIERRAWATDLLDELGLPRAILRPTSRPGELVGALRPEVAADAGLSKPPVLAHVGSHDTASAVVGVPAEDERFAYIACGTWGLVGVELERPILTDASRAANFTNELGVDGRIRYLRNVMGLWLLQESLRTWEHAGEPSDLTGLLAAAAELPAGGPQVDVDDPVFMPPGDMPARIAKACRQAGQTPPSGRPALVRCIVDSLAAAFARTVEDAERLSGRDVRVVHLVGGGSRNTLLCQLTADACGRPVVAGPVEATALGNVLVQARAHRLIEGDLEALRSLVRVTSDLRRYESRRVATERGR
jgi:rhamnulokinase